MIDFFPIAFGFGQSGKLTESFRESVIPMLYDEAEKWERLTEAQALRNILTTVREWLVSGVPPDWRMSGDEQADIANFIDCQFEYLGMKNA